MRRWLFGSVWLVVGVLAGLSVRDVPARATAQVECAQMNGDVDGDAKLGLSDIILLLQYIFLPEAKRPSLLPSCAHPCPLPATGQTECYDVGENVVECANEQYPGQDGFYRAGYSPQDWFVDNGDGTVTDNCTGLMWQKETAPGKYTWQQALQYCENLELAGYTDWRLPNVRELQSIVDYGRPGPAIDPVFHAFSNWYCSSSSVAVGPADAWVVSFGDGWVRGDNKAFDFHVLAVRGGL